MIPPQVTYGLNETHTTWMPITFWLSAWNYGKNGPVTLKLRMDKPFNPIDSTINYDSQTTPSTGFHDVKTRTGNGALTFATRGNPSDFPTNISNPQDISPQWWNWFSQIYEYYTVLGCSYEINMQTAQRDVGHQTLAMMKFESTGSSGTFGIDTGAQLQELMYYKDIEKRNLYAHGNPMGKPYESTFKGYYKRGEADRNVRNDEDVKTWHRTNDAPTLKETLNLMVFEHPFNDNAFNSWSGLTCQISLRYKVQFKDLKTQFRYPAATQATSPILTAPTDILASY